MESIWNHKIILYQVQYSHCFLIILNKAVNSNQWNRYIAEVLFSDNAEQSSKFKQMKRCTAKVLFSDDAKQTKAVHLNQ